MRIVTDLKVSVGWSVGSVGNRGLMLSIAVKGGFLLKHNSPTQPQPEPPQVSGDLHCEGEHGRVSLVYPSDWAIFKPRADVLLAGSAHAPNEQPVTHLDAVLRVGQLTKVVHVVGDRKWLRRFLFWRSASPPVGFKTMPLSYERAYGGRGFKKNPHGLGYDKKSLPNIESTVFKIRSPRDKPAPTSLGPIPADWEPRRSRVGTYKGKWLKERWPWFPDDFDWSYFNAAPEDQQVDGYLHGDEELQFENLHPEHPLYRAQLPCLRARSFVEVEVPETRPDFREVKLNLDTLWIDLENEKLVLVWRGLTPIRSVKFKEITHVAALTEPLGLPERSKEEVRDWMLRRIREEKEGGSPSSEQAAEAAAAEASREAFETEMAAIDTHQSELEKELAAAEEDVAKQIEQQKAQLVALGIDRRVLDQPAHAQTGAEMRAQLNAEIARLTESHPDASAELADVQNDLDELERMEQEFAALTAEEPAPPTCESVKADIAQGLAVHGADLSGQNFSNLDLSGADLSGTDFSGADLSGTKLVGARLTGASFSEANLAGVNFSRAFLDGADFSGSRLQGAKFCGASVNGASFSELYLPGADFSKCTGRHPHFSKSNLEGANFTGAKLPHADFSAANVKAASFVEAELVSADFGGASAAEINMEKADLTNLRAGEKANFSGGKFREARAPKSIWEGSVLDRADFSRAVLTGALFEDASVKETRFDRADLTKASFEDAFAQRALITNANLLRASFNRANLTEARLDGSNLYEAGLWETVLERTKMDGANVKRTLIS